jgi:hypothetical protein
MKKLFMIVLTLVFSLTLLGCTPDEDTATDIQKWYDECNAIESCKDKIDEIRDEELSESDIIIAIQQQLLDHEERIQALETRALLIDTMVTGPSNTFDFMTEYEKTGVVGLSENEEGDVVILANTTGIISEEFSALTLKAELLDALKLDLSEIFEPETIDIVITYDIEYGEPDEEGDREEFYISETIVLSDLLESE